MGAGRYSLDQAFGIALPRPLTFAIAVAASLVVVAIVVL
jgi:hypothetical protein